MLQKDGIRPPEWLGAVLQIFRGWPGPCAEYAVSARWSNP